MATSSDPDKKYFNIDSENVVCPNHAYKTNKSLFNRHVECSMHQRDLRLHLDILRVCRQTYAETSLLPYSLNTFVFKDDRAFVRFSKRSTLLQLQALTRLEICFSWTDMEDCFLTDDEIPRDPNLDLRSIVLSTSMIKSLKNLKMLHLYFRGEFQFPEEASDFAAEKGGWTAESFLLFSPLRLEPKQVTVIVSTDENDDSCGLEWDKNYEYPPLTLALKGRQVMAEQVKQFLTGSDSRKLVGYLEALEEVGVPSHCMVQDARDHEHLWRIPYRWTGDGHAH